MEELLARPLSVAQEKLRNKNIEFTVVQYQPLRPRFALNPKLYRVVRVRCIDGIVELIAVPEQLDTL